MNSKPDNPKRSLAKSLGALFALTSGLMLGSTSNTQAAAANPTSSKTDRDKQLEVRIQKVQEQFSQGAVPEVNESNPSTSDVHPMWWGNWHNWHPGWGWRNGGWGNGGWHNWHNWHNW
jgi:rSAM-associated Gly-rich repeat protein